MCSVSKFLVDIKSDIRIGNDEISALGPQSQTLLDIFKKTFNIYQALVFCICWLNLENLTALWHLSSTVYYALRFKFDFVAKK